MDMDHQDGKINLPAGQLVYGGVAIREKGEMLSLTDMWKAAGSPEGQRPDDWKKDSANRAFLDHVALISNAPVEGIWKGRRGNNGGTMAHWQVALAYAKYLSPDFHMWCNSVVRAHMEGAPANPLPPATAEQIDRIFGIVRMLAHKVTMIEQAQPLAIDAIIDRAVEAKLAEQHLAVRRGQTALAIWQGAGLPAKLRGTTVWFGNRLEEMGCGLMKAENGNKPIRIFDPDKAAICLKNGLLHKAKVYASERMGQGRFKLVGGAA